MTEEHMKNCPRLTKYGSNSPMPMTGLTVSLRILTDSRQKCPNGERFAV